MSSVWPLSSSQPEAHPDWRRAGVAWLLLTALVLVTMAGTTASMVGIWWTSGTFNHALALPPLLAWLVWRSRGRWLALAPQPDRRWWPVLAALSLLVLVNDAALANAPGHFALVGLLVASVPALLGMGVARALAFPLLYAFFMVPFGEFLMPQMMEATATFTVWALRLTGVPVYRDGLNFVIPSGNWSVVEACSGIRYLMASACVGALYAYLNYASLRKRLLFFGFALLVPVVANWLRAYLIVMLGHLSDNRLAAGADHLVYGWVFFGLIMLVMFMVGARWMDEPAALLRQLEAGDEAGKPRGQAAAAGTGWGAALTCIALACGPVLAGLAVQRAAPAAEPAQLPASVPGWGQATPAAGHEAIGAWTPRFVAPDAQAMARYDQAPGQAVVLHLAQYWGQTREHKLLSSENVAVTSDDLRWRAAGRAAVALGLQAPDGALSLQPAVLMGRDSGSSAQRPRLLVVQLVRVDGRWMAPGAEARLALARARLSGRSDHALSWMLATEVPVVDDAAADARAVQAAADRLAGFIQAAWAQERS